MSSLVKHVQQLQADLETASQAYRKAYENLADGQYELALELIPAVTKYAQCRWGDNFVRARPVRQDWYPDGGGPEGSIHVVLKQYKHDYWDGPDMQICVRVVSEDNDANTYLEVKQYNSYGL